MKKFFLVVVVIFLSIGLVFYFFTLQTFQFVEMNRMKWSGIASVVTPEFHYFEKNNCSSSTPQNCQCVLLLHGLGDFALTWRQMLSASPDVYVKDLHFFAPNLPGALSTPKLKTQDEYNVQNMAKLVSDYFLPKCESWVVAGNSYGGWMSIFMALKSDKIKGLLLLGPAGLKKDYSSLTNYFLDPTITGARDFYNKIYYQPKPVPDFIFQRVVERLKTQTVLEQLRSVREEDFLDTHFKDIKIPVSYVWGEADRVIPPDWADAYAKSTNNSKLKIIKSCGHVPQKECFLDVLPEFNDLLKRISSN